MRTTHLPSGEAVPQMGQGTWRMAEEPSRRHDEIAALRLGLDLGMTLIDTAEMYGDGRAEELVGEAIAGRRDQVFLVSKVLPGHATRAGTVRACEESLRRMKTDRIDLYLLHWRGAVPLEETLAGFDRLVGAGRIRHWGVSNFDVADMEDLVSAGGTACVANQVLYNLTRRGIEFDLLPWCQRRGVCAMAYSPIEQGRMPEHPALQTVASRHRVTASQVALAWVVRHERAIAIPKAANAAHVRENRAAVEVRLTEEDLAALDRAFAPPTRKVALEMI